MNGIMIRGIALCSLIAQPAQASPVEDSIDTMEQARKIGLTVTTETHDFKRDNMVVTEFVVSWKPREAAGTEPVSLTADTIELLVGDGERESGQPPWMFDTRVQFDKVNDQIVARFTLQNDRLDGAFLVVNEGDHFRYWLKLSEAIGWKEED